MPGKPQPPPRPNQPVVRPRKGALGTTAARGPSNPTLQLAIGPDGIGLELAEPVELPFMRIVELSTALTGVRFPVDVSGGVTRFRHRRGQLRVLRIEVASRLVERAVAPLLRGLVGARTPDVWLDIAPARATVCVTDFPQAGEPSGSVPVLAFDVHVIAEGEDLAVVVANARGTDLPEPAIAVAISCVDAALGGAALRAGAVFTLRRPAAELARRLLPGVGARVPSTDGVRWAALGADAGTWILQAVAGADPATPTPEALRAHAAAVLVRDGDEALMRDDPIEARTRYLEALERAPHHPEIVSRIVQIDAREPGRAEAALLTLAELRTKIVEMGAGVMAGELLGGTGDVDAGLAILERAAEAERAPFLAARAYEIAARMTRDAETKVRWLDQALARAPRSITARWARMEARLDLGRLEEAIADVEHIEALSRGPRQKYGTWMQAGRTWSARNLRERAGTIFEHALRFAPDEPEALAGLGAALLGDGRIARGVSLLRRALERARAQRQPESAILLSLARALAERLDDLPTAISHVAAIPLTAREAPMARGLEGRWRAALGDFTGAALAFARLRDLAASMDSTDQTAVGAAADLLLEAAEVALQQHRDPVTAQRHLAAALRLVPHHAGARRAYREAGGLVLRGETDRDDP